ncbi:hypothetical protein KIM372_03690 [Bombiscardovia nodaiensis]|uniref:Uncharacterized protein n=1 Tax=Bombiscardovia nodaiensis TaxID=2932181 RepID=A0ABM8B6I9_9BIFI|nr:hypothetical protein KIM372_03690 [Bombiscardovia nodaiensis]
MKDVTSPSKDEAEQAISKSAHDLRINIYKMQPAAHDSYRGRVLFVFLGDQEAFKSQGGSTYPTFSQADQNTHVRPASALSTEDLRGDYASNANAGQLQSLMARLRAAGLQTSARPASSMNALVYSLGQGSFAAALAIVMVTLMVALGYSSSSNRSIHAIKSLHGYTSAAIGASELGSLALSVGVGLMGLLILGLPFLALYNHFNQLWRFALVFAAGQLALAMYCALCLLVLGGADSLRQHIPQIVNGQGAPLRDGILAAVVQILVLALMFATASGAVGRVSAVRHTESQLGQWSRIPPAYVLRLSVHRRHADDMAESSKLMRVIQDMDAEGQVLLARYSPARGGPVEGPEAHNPYLPNGSRSMLVNPRYLDFQTVRDQAGQRIRLGEQTKASFTLLVPASYTGDTQNLLDQYVQTFTNTCSWQENSCEGIGNIEGRIIRTQNGQEVATYHGTKYMPAEDQQDLSLTDPVLAVLSPSTGIPGPMEYLSYTSTASLLFFDADGLDKRLTQVGIRSGYQGIDNAADSVAVTLAITKREQRGDLLGLALGAFALILATLVCASVYCQTRRKASFVEVIHGYGFLRRHALFFTSELGAAVLSLMITALLGHMSQPTDALIGVTALLAVSCCTFGAVAGYESRFRSEDIKRP